MTVFADDDDNPRREQSDCSLGRHDLAETLEWAPHEPLPSSQLFLTAFAGTAPLTASDILDPAADLVACHRQRRLALEVLSSRTASLEQLRHAGGELVVAQEDIQILVTVIDGAVANRLTPLSSHTEQIESVLDTQPLIRGRIPVHTESIGEIAARMARWWEAIFDKAQHGLTEDCPEVAQLYELCQGYDCLAAEIECGRRLPTGM
ncbi:hypothetical protein ACWDSJ_26280 [Nocardia sp. NPDC003482]